MKAAIYARVSTTMQEDNESLKFQIEKCKDFCKLKGYKLLKIIQDVESGGKDTRVGFLELQEDIKNSAFDVLVVYESSRISRKTLTMINFVNTLQEQDIKFISISQPELDTTTPTGTLFFNIQASLGDYERKQISSRVKSGKWARAKVGRWQGGFLPLGYKKDKDGKTIIIDEDKAEVVKAIFDMYISTQSLKQVGKFFKRSTESIRWIITNHFYTGQLRYGKKEKNINTGKIKLNSDYQYFPGIHPVIIDPKTFEHAQRIINTKKRDFPTKHKLLFSSLIICECGGKMFSHKRAKRIDYCCDKCNKSISSQKAEDVIINKLLELKELEDLNNENIELEKYKNDIEKYKKQIENLKKEKNKYVSFCAKGIITETELKNFINELEPNILFLIREIKTLEEIIEKQKITGEKENNLKILQTVLANMEDSDRNDLHKLFKLLIEKIDFVNRDPLIFNIYIK
ncbi:recombinase family protein [Sebaldella termitidis]|uniref:recombinase family protein n=1 Tax=Sebaldella termitidis TaxID=826 RepID=UPI003EBD0293